MNCSLEYLNVVTDLLGPHISLCRIDSPALRVRDADRYKETLLRAYHLRHSFDTFDPMLVNFIIERLGASISGLRAEIPTTLDQSLPDKEVLRSTLILCATGLRSQAKSYHVCTLAYLGLQSQMQPDDLQILLTHVKPPAEEDLPPLDCEAVTSWPLPIISMSEDPKKSALSQMVKDYADNRAQSGKITTRTQAYALSTICN